jgi:hypothetical protein
MKLILVAFLFLSCKPDSAPKFTHEDYTGTLTAMGEETWGSVSRTCENDLYFVVLMNFGTGETHLLANRPDQSWLGKKVKLSLVNTWPNCNVSHSLTEIK